MKLSQAIEGFTLQARANLSPPTVTSYAYHLSQLERFLHNPPLADITSDNIVYWIIIGQPIKCCCHTTAAAIRRLIVGGGAID